MAIVTDRSPRKRKTLEWPAEAAEIAMRHDDATKKCAELVEISKNDEQACWRYLKRCGVERPAERKRRHYQWPVEALEIVIVLFRAFRFELARQEKEAEANRLREFRDGAIERKREGDFTTRNGISTRGLSCKKPATEDTRRHASTSAQAARNILSGSDAIC